MRSYTKQGIATMAVCLAALGAAVAPAAAQEEDPYVYTAPVPQAYSATIDSVTMNVIDVPRSYTGWAGRGKTLPIHAAVELTVTCRAVDDWSSTGAEDTVYSDEDEEFTFCEYSDHLPAAIGTTWTETEVIQRDFYQDKFAPRFATGTLTVQWLDNESVITLESARVKRTYKDIWRRHNRSRSHVRRVYADTEYDRFYNICINQNATTYVSGGRIYCNVTFTSRWKEWKKETVIDRTKIKWMVSGVQDMNGLVFTREA